MCMYAGILRECLQWEFSELVGPPGPAGTYGSDNSDSDMAAHTGARSALHERRSTGSHLAADEPSALAATSDSSDDDLEGLLALTISEPAGVGAGAASNAAGAAGLQPGQSPLDSTGGGGAARPRSRGQKGLNFEALLDDLVALSFLVRPPPA